MIYKIWFYKSLKLLLAGIALLIAISPVLKAAPGDLDLTFGAGGRVISDTGLDDEVRAVAVLPDGKLIVAINKRLIRYSANGTLEQIFGNTADSYTGIAVQTDGKIVTVGNQTRGSVGCTAYRVNIRRFNADGTVDSSFGASGGAASYSAGCDESGYRAYGYDLALQTDGKIVAAGQIYSGTYPNDSKALAIRLNANGTFDTGFNGDGVGVYAMGNYSDKANRIAVNPVSGRIALAGYRGENGTRYAAVLMLTSIGNVHFSYGNLGVASLNSFDSEFFAAAFQADGKLLAGGAKNNSSGFLLRFAADGTLDATFSGDGVVSWDTGYSLDAVTAIAQQTDGKILAASYSDFFNVNPTTKTDFVLYRFNPNGSFDASFAGDGKLSTDFGKHEFTRSMALQPDGRIILAGVTDDDETNKNIALARYLP